MRPSHYHHGAYARPHYAYVHHCPGHHYGPPHHYYYRPYYTHWWVHPYYRSYHTTVIVVGFGFTTYAWTDWWAPPARPGWVWIPGAWYFGIWYPGYWQPTAPPPPRYVYVPGHWSGDAYVEGYNRLLDRPGWVWVEGYYLDDGTYIEAHWKPAKPGPEGYTWEPGFFDGEIYIDGFWRPGRREGFTWVAAFYNADGSRSNGYWMPVEQPEGQVWVPGWFDGREWIAGYWITDAEFDKADPDHYKPPEGVDAGWEETEDQEAPAGPDDAEPLALPVEVES